MALKAKIDGLETLRRIKERLRQRRFAPRPSPLAELAQTNNPERVIAKLEGTITHNFLFTLKDGSILTRSVFSSIFRYAMYRLTGKAVNPHLVRSMAITHFKRSGATNEQMDSLAVGMKHSRNMQDSDYDRRTQQEKVKPALDMMLRQKAGALPK